jgi:hypothetical protein
MTPFEIGTRLEGAREREIERRRFEANMVAALMNVSGRVLKVPQSGDKLLGLDANGKPKKRMKPTSKEKLIADAKKKNRTYADYLAEHGA